MCKEIHVFIYVNRFLYVFTYVLICFYVFVYMCMCAFMFLYAFFVRLIRFLPIWALAPMGQAHMGLGLHGPGPLGVERVFPTENASRNKNDIVCSRTIMFCF